LDSRVSGAVFCREGFLDFADGARAFGPEGFHDLEFQFRQLWLGHAFIHLLRRSRYYKHSRSARGKYCHTAQGIQVNLNAEEFLTRRRRARRGTAEKG
jgi:hypothetical protein